MRAAVALALAALLGFLVVLAMVHEARSTQEHTALRLQWRDCGRGGGRGFYLLCQGLEPRTCSLDWSQPWPSSVTLIVREPEVTQELAVRLSSWVSGGGQLVLVPWHDNRLLEILGVGYIEADQPPGTPEGLAWGGHRLAVQPRGARLDMKEQRGDPGIADTHGALAARLRWGKGQVWVVPEAWLLCNEGLDCEDNAWLALQMARAGGPPVFLIPPPGASLQERLLSRSWVRAQLALLAALGLLFWLNARVRDFTQIREVVVRQRSQLEFVDAAAAIYERSGAARLALAAIWRWEAWRMGRCLGLRGPANLAELATRPLLQDLGLAQVCQKVQQELQHGQESTARVLALARELQALLTRVEQALKAPREGAGHGTV